MQWYCVWGGGDSSGTVWGEEGTCSGTVCGEEGTCSGTVCGEEGTRSGTVCTATTVHTCIRTYTSTHTRTYICICSVCS